MSEGVKDQDRRVALSDRLRMLKELLQELNPIDNADEYHVLFGILVRTESEYRAVRDRELDGLRP